MKSLEADLIHAGLDDHQLNLLRQQHTHLRGEGRAAELGSLALRSRFINLDDLVDKESQDDSNVIGDHFTLQTILPLEFCRRFVCVPTEFSKGVLTLRCAQPLKPAQRERIHQILRAPVSALKFVPSSRQEVCDLLLRIEQSGSVNGLITVLKHEGLEAGRASDTVVIGATGNDASGNKLQVTGSIKATAFNTSSDRRLKNSITQLDSGNLLSQLQQLNAYHYRFNSDPTGQIRYGVIAQEVATLFPHAVSYDGQGLMAVDYGALGAIAASAVGQLSTSALDGSYATATVIVNAGQAKIVPVASEGIELVAEGNTVKAIAAGKSIKASWIKMG